MRLFSHSESRVLIPRKHHIVRTAYELNDDPSAYGDHGIRIYGIWSPLVEGRICTHATKWKMFRKAVDVQEGVADQGGVLLPLGLVAMTVPLWKKRHFRRGFAKHRRYPR